jgi:YYY domain-containing protein
MTEFLTWYLILTVLGWLTFPLVYQLFPALSDRGYTLARTIGMLVWGYVFWLFVSLGFARNNLGGIIFALAILIALSAWSLITHYSSIITFLRSNKSLIVTTEILFLLAFAFLAVARAANPELASTEKPMELMFINSILRSETFPPQDAWLSGYGISYYYFGYVMTAMLARLSDINGSTAHNLMTSLIFALGAIGSFGIVYNLLSSLRITHYELRNPQSVMRNSEIVNRKYPMGTMSSIATALLAPLFLLLVSNFEALLEVLHRRGLFWIKDPVTGSYTSAFWTWLDMKELSQPPIEPLGWMPDRYLWWWRASRVIQDYDITGGHREVIDEFPFFSFLLGDLHPHVLAIPFGLLAVSVALNIFLGGARGKINVFSARLNIAPTGFAFAALVLGGLAFLNTWDILIAAALIVSAFALWRANEDGWAWARLEELILFALPLGILSLLLYFPFYLGFSSQAGGILPNFMYPTRGMHLWVMWGTLFIPILTFLLYVWIKEPARPNWKLALTIGLGSTFFLALLTLLVGMLGFVVEKDFVTATLASYNMTVSQFLSATSLRRLKHIGSLVTLLVVLIPTLAFLFARNKEQETSNEENLEPESSSLVTHHVSLPFVFLLLTLGTLLILAPEFVYLRDQFGYRINTVFKFYYQAWMLLSLVAAFGVGYVLQRLRGFADVMIRVLIGVVIFCGLLYPVFGLMTKTNNFKPVFGYNLNDFVRIQRENADDAAGIEFLLTQPEGVVAEAVGGGYSYYGRVSTHTGYPTVLGWIGHEAQWRGGYQLHGTREADIEMLYATARWDDAKTIIDRYNIRYIFIGNLERTSMPVNEEKFALYLKPIFQQGSTIIYEAP